MQFITICKFRLTVQFAKMRKTKICRKLHVLFCVPPQVSYLIRRHETLKTLEISDINYIVNFFSAICNSNNF